MKFSPKAIFFDWDHTLWDHDRNASEVIQELLAELALLESIPHSPKVVWQEFTRINDALWDDYQHGRIDQKTLRETRFELFFEALGIRGDANLFSNIYLERTPRKKHLIPDAYQVIEKLAAKYPLYVLTNGFDDIQHVYSEFVENKNYPKLERLSNWGKNRFFFNQYFKMIEDWHHTEQIVIQFNQQYFSLDTGNAPDFMDKEKYMAWLMGELLI